MTEKQPEVRAMVRIVGPHAVALRRTANQTGRSLAQVMKGIILGYDPDIGLSAETLARVRWKIAKTKPGMSVGDVATELLLDWVDGRLKLDCER